MENKAPAQSRRQWSPDQKREIVQKAGRLRDNGQTWRMIARELDVLESSLMKWRKQYEECPEEESDKIRILPVTTAIGSCADVELELGDVRVRFSANIPASYVGELLLELRTTC